MTEYNQRKGQVATGIFILLLLIVLIIATRYEPERIPAPEPVVPDFAALEDVKAKKSAFFNYMRPLAEAENKRIKDLRKKIKRLQANPLNKDEKAWLMALAKDIRLELSDPVSDKDYTQLLKKIDLIPTSLVLAQAAIESAWGTSRFAREGNNFFGQWCFTQGCGIIPAARPAGATHEVRVFSSPQEAVASYFHNINSHPAYKKVRELRYQTRVSNQPMHGCDLATGLEDYSERGIHYINEVRQMIRINHLSSEGATTCTNLEPAASSEQIATAPDTTRLMEDAASSNEKTSDSDSAIPISEMEPYNSDESVQEAAQASETL